MKSTARVYSPARAGLFALTLVIALVLDAARAQNEPILVLILGLITCGLYMIYWNLKVSEVLNKVSGREVISPGDGGSVVEGRMARIQTLCGQGEQP